MKNIAIIVASLKSGGAERIAGLLSIYLSRTYQVYIFIGDKTEIVYDYKGILVDCSVNGVENIFTTVKEKKKEYKINYAISFDYAMNLVNTMTKTEEGVIISHRCAVGKIVPYPYRMATKIRRWYGYADKIVSLSFGAKEDLIKNFDIDSNKISTIYNFIDKDNIRNKANDELPEKVQKFIGTSKLILNVGRLTEQKNQKKLLMQFLWVSNEYDVKCIILGSGPLEKELKDLALALGIDSKVLFLPYCSNPFPYYKKAFMFVLSSNYEGFGNVIIESMLNETPCVCVDCFAGPRELIKGSRDYSCNIQKFEVCERGILVENADTDSDGRTTYLGDAMKVYLKDRKLCEKIVDRCNIYMRQYNNEMLATQWINTIETTEIGVRKRLFEYPELQSVRKVIVYGTGVFGRLTMKQLAMFDGKIDELCFAISNKKQYPASDVMGYHVYEITELQKYKDDAIVFIGVSDIYGGEQEVISNLIKYGFRFTFPDFLTNYY